MTSSVREWLNLRRSVVSRFCGNHVGRPDLLLHLARRPILQTGKNAKTTTPALWMVHSGGFYTVEKQKSLRVGPEQVHWFRWEAAMTWLSGMALLFMVYYFSGGLIDP